MYIRAHVHTLTRTHIHICMHTHTFAMITWAILSAMGHTSRQAETVRHGTVETASFSLTCTYKAKFNVWSILCTAVTNTLFILLAHTQLTQQYHLYTTLYKSISNMNLNIYVQQRVFLHFFSIKTFTTEIFSSSPMPAVCMEVLLSWKRYKAISSASAIQS